jgi:hypothetical protein
MQLERKRLYSCGEGAMKTGLAILDHRTALSISSNVTRNIRRLQGRTAVNIEPREVIKILNKAKIKFTLVGAHGIAGWLEEPRASQDVDVIVHARHKAAVQAVHKAFPELTVLETAVVTRFIDPATNLAVIDLMRPQSDLHSAVRDYSVPVGKTHRVPDLEMALALKFAALESPNRRENKKRQDKVDFFSMVAAHGEEIAEDRLFSLGEMVKNGGGKEILKLVEEARAESGLPPEEAE